MTDQHEGQDEQGIVSQSPNPAIVIPISQRNNGTAPVTRLAVADAPFAATGEARVKVTRNGVASWLRIPIRAVEIEEVHRMVGSLRPKIPTYRDKINGQWKTILNEADAAYQQALASYQITFSKVWVLLAIGVDVVDAGGEIVWSADNRVCEMDRAVKALSDMGLVDNQLMTIFRAVQDLTDDAQELHGQD